MLCRLLTARQIALWACELILDQSVRGVGGESELEHGPRFGVLNE
jgi:hypothetical protein